MSNYQDVVDCPVCLGASEYQDKDCFFCDADGIMFLDDDQYGHLDYCEKCGHITVSNREQLKHSYYRSTRNGKVGYFNHETEEAIDCFNNITKIERD